MIREEDKARREGKIHTQMGFTVEGIAQALARTPEDVLKSLCRLEKRGEVYKKMGCWLVGKK